MKKKMGLGKKVLIGIGVCFVIGIIAAANNSPMDSSKNKETTPGGKTETAPVAKTVWKKAGMYKVGADLAAGEYAIEPLGDAAYYAVAADSSGDMGSIITNDLLAGCTVFVTVKDGQYLTVQSAKFTNADSYEVKVANPVNQGMYRIGRDIPAGEYKITSRGMPYYAVQKDSYNELSSIVSNDTMFEGSLYVTVKDGQYLLLKQCVAERVN